MTKKYPLDNHNHLRFCELIQARTGIRLGESRRDPLTNALKECAESLDCDDLSQLFSCLESAPTDSEEWHDLIKKVTIGETYFLRDSDYMEALRCNILPDLIERHQTDHILRLWSAGCATGEEPYSLAILLRQILYDIDEWNISILATDINRQSLKQAAVGHYRAWSFRESNPGVRPNYFTTDGSVFRLNPEVKKMVTFAYHNLSENNYPSPVNQTCNIDLILCRNVTIYLPTPLIHEIADRFHQCLSEGGWLMVGPSESHLEIYKQFQMVNFHGATAYKKVPHVPSFPSLWTSTLGQTNQRAERLPEEATSNKPSKHQKTTPAQSRSSKPSKPAPQGSQAKNATEKKSVSAKSEVDLCRKGEEFMKQHRYEEARQCFLSCLAEEKDSITALYWMAGLEANAGRLDEARNWAEKALQHDPLRSEVHYTLALIHQVQGEPQEAVNRLKKVIYLDPNFILAHFGLYHLYQKLGDSLEAERHRTMAVHLASKLSPDLVLPGSDDLTASQMLMMAQTVPDTRS